MRRHCTAEHGQRSGEKERFHDILHRNAHADAPLSALSGSPWAACVVKWPCFGPRSHDAGRRPWRPVMIPRLCRTVQVSGSLPRHHEHNQRLHLNCRGYRRVRHEVAVRTPMVMGRNIATDVVSAQAKQGDLDVSRICPLRCDHCSRQNAGHTEQQHRAIDPQMMTYQAVHKRFHTSAFPWPHEKVSRLLAFVAPHRTGRSGPNRLGALRAIRLDLVR